MADKSLREVGRRTVLVVDDSLLNREMLKDILAPDYDVLEARDGVEAVEVLEGRARDLSLVILDINMPRLDGFGVLLEMNRRGWIERVPVVTISAEDGPSFIERAYSLGVTDFIGRPFHEGVVRHRVRNTIRLYQKQNELLALVTSQMVERERQSNLMVSILAHIVEFHNGESGLHVEHIATMVGTILSHLRLLDPDLVLDPSEAACITMASALHDIGKIAVPSRIINKPGRLTEEEFAVMRTHSARGAEMLESLPFAKDEPLVRCARDICRWHHERWDGGGYPDGLVGDQIPLSAQVVALADVYDALTSERVYKPAYDHDTAVRMILGGECGAFNPVLLACLEEAADEIRREMGRCSAETVGRAGIQTVISQIENIDELSRSDKESMVSDVVSMARAMGTAAGT
ncbi:HD-GYP domain-containing protein [Caniella muris]|uniref:HD-GYP domain-containing protein n=1 Tax=Caniella muris TaxID=2941502 RepID=UPI00203D4E5A|nr:HD domain-containing phosphohydrolase [Caniella muris]